MDSEGNHQSKPGNPMLRHTQTCDLYRETCSSDKTIITMKQMKDDLAFKVEVLFTSKFMINARDVEDALQKRFQHYLLGIDFGDFQIGEQNMKFQIGRFTLLGLLILETSSR